MMYFQHSFIKAIAVASTLSLSVLSAPTFANESGVSALFGQQSQKFLKVHQAFNVKVHLEGREVVAVFKVTPEHYIYRDKLSLRLPEGVTASEWRFDKSATMIDDPTFGNVAVFEEDVVARATLSADADIAQSATLRWQGCAKAGLCYPPETTKFELNLPKTTEKNQQSSTDATKLMTATPQTKDNANTATQKTINSSSQDTPKSTAVDTADISKLPDNLVTPAPKAQVEENSSTDNDAMTAQVQTNTAITTTAADAKYTLNHQPKTHADPFGIHDNPALAVVLLFLAGLLLSFTPCVYPMIPIVANIVARQNGINSKKGLALSASYGVGVALSYGILGALMAWFGRTLNIVAYLQNPAVLIGFALLFACLALYMFDVIKISLPAFIRERLQATSQSADTRLGSLGGSLMAGMLSALVVSPCVSAPMAGALAAVSVSGSAWFGFVALFALGLGLSIPLMLIGVAQGRLMPKAGAWMAKVKEFCGLLLFAVSLALIERVFISPVMLLMWAVWFLVLAVWLWRLGALLARILAVLSALWAGCLVAGAAMGEKDAWRPLAGFSTKQQANYQDVHTTELTKLDEVLATHEKVLIDITAEWCIECRIMERELFTERPQSMSDVQVVKFDITEMTDDGHAMLERYQLIGPPALLLYKKGELQEIMLGQVRRAEFEQALKDF